MEREIKDIVIIGTGNVSYHLARAFLGKGLNIVQVVARRESSAKRYAEELGVHFVNTAPTLLAEADLYILAVNDDQIKNVARGLTIENKFLVHTSGSVPMEILRGISADIGVFYPLQTLSYGKDIDFSAVPLCIEANTVKNAAVLKQLAGKISTNVLEIDSERRKAFHLAAVFASNFSYHMYTLAAEILKLHDLDPELLLPLIRETVQKAISSPAGSAQTGPAMRRDMKIIEQHLQQLEDQQMYREIYRLLTDSIISHHKDPDNEL